MGDLIVKAATGIGNALKLQDQAGQLCFSTIDDGGVITDKVHFPAGHIIQVQSTQTSAYAATGSSYIEAFTDLSLTTRGANKILITVNINGVVMFDAAAYIRFNLTDGSSSIQELTGHFAKATGSSDDPYASFGAQYLTGVLSTNTTYTYNVEYKNNQGSQSARLSGASQSLRTLTLMEIQQ